MSTELVMLFNHLILWCPAFAQGAILWPPDVKSWLTGKDMIWLPLSVFLWLSTLTTFLLIHSALLMLTPLHFLQMSNMLSTLEFLHLRYPHGSLPYFLKVSSNTNSSRKLYPTSCKKAIIIPSKPSISFFFKKYLFIFGCVGILLPHLGFL